MLKCPILDFCFDLQISSSSEDFEALIPFRQTIQALDDPVSYLPPPDIRVKKSKKRSSRTRETLISEAALRDSEIEAIRVDEIFAKLEQQENLVQDIPLENQDRNGLSMNNSIVDVIMSDL